ncbi:MAG: hypothetical protein EZS28_010284 [Streblomastix strix]|uniref:Uncharacterized protein n=1 Tax=Streblomastix strix TaxID=222440 RepID=A0A5J4WH91_9EUKA|nr:MAG: hypothetical protein EZS28_010284 [Streblomastix strix]
MVYIMSQETSSVDYANRIYKNDTRKQDRFIGMIPGNKKNQHRDRRQQSQAIMLCIFIPFKSILSVDELQSLVPVRNIPPSYPVGEVDDVSDYASHSYIKASMI